MSEQAQQAPEPFTITVGNDDQPYHVYLHRTADPEARMLCEDCGEWVFVALVDEIATCLPCTITGKYFEMLQPGHV